MSDLDRDLAREIWISAVRQQQLDPDEVERRFRDLWHRYPPSAIEGGYDLVPFIRGVAGECGLDPDQFVKGCQAAILELRAEHVAAVEAAEELLRGDG